MTQKPNQYEENFKKNIVSLYQNEKAYRKAKTILRRISDRPERDPSGDPRGIQSGYVRGYRIGKPLRARIDAAIAERSKRTGVTADRVVRELAFVNATDVIDTQRGEVLENASRDDTACISAVKVKTGEDFTKREIRLCNKTKALELLGKHLGIFSDNVKLSAESGVTIIDDTGE